MAKKYVHTRDDLIRMFENMVNRLDKLPIESKVGYIDGCIDSYKEALGFLKEELK